MFEFLKKEKSDSVQYYNPEKLLSLGCDYSLVFSQRSDGKTFGFLKHCLKEFIESGKQFAYVRWMEMDIKGNRARQIFNGINRAGVVEELTKGEWNFIKYYSRQFFLAKRDEEGDEIVDNNPCGFVFAVSEQSHDKSSNYDEVKNIFFDEVFAGYYPFDAYSNWMNLVSTIVRQQGDVKILMAGNTLNFFDCPIVQEMNLTEAIKSMKIGDILMLRDLEGDSGTISIEYGSVKDKKKDSNKYFIGQNKTNRMIKEGEWEFKNYKRLPVDYEYNKENILFLFFISYRDEIMQCEVLQTESLPVLYIHTKSTPIRDDSLTFTDEESFKSNCINNIYDRSTSVQNRILDFFSSGRVFYQSNRVGAVVEAYLTSCKQ